MQAYESINALIPTLKKTDSMGMAMLWMEEIRVGCLPVTDGHKFLGFIEHQQEFKQDSHGPLILDASLKCSSCWVYSDEPLYEVMKVTSENQLSMAAVLNRDKSFLGVVTVEDVLSAYADSLSIKTQGSVLVLSLPLKDYHLSEIVRLIESENNQIINSFITQDPLDEGSIKLTLKLNKADLRYIKATLERFGYKVIEHYQEETGISGEEDRIANLLRFLDI